MTMEDIQPNWKGLPVEILLQIFQFAQDLTRRKQPYFALVCKAWRIPAQTVLYSSVRICNLLHLKKFHGTVESNLQLGSMVKRFTYSFNANDPRDKEEKLDLMTTLYTTCLPNLEEIYDYDLRSYVPVLNALQKLQLKHLKRINPPNKRLEKSELAAYATCALFIKDRIESIEIIKVEDEWATDSSGTETSTAQLYTKRLYNNLYQFDMLESLYIERTTSTQLQDLECILKSCKSLKSLDFYFDQSSRDDGVQNQRTSIEAILTSLPARNMKEINCTVNVSNDYSILLYIMHKFSQLEHLNFGVHVNNSVHLNQNILYQWLNYLLKIKTFRVENLSVDKNAVSDTIENYWSLTSKPGTKDLNMIYSTSHLQENTCLLDIIKDEDNEESYLSLTYRASNHTSEHIGFFEKNGVYLKQLTFDFSDHLHFQRYSLPTDFFSHTLKHCPNIQTLYIDHCIINEDTVLDYRNKISIQELCFTNCVFHPGVLERVSLLISEIKNLCITGPLRGDLAIQPPRLPGDIDLEILMPNTDIDCVNIKIYLQNFYLKVFSLNQVDYYYYKYYDGNLKASTEEEYKRANDNVRIYICCKTNPTIQIG